MLDIDVADAGVVMLKGRLDASQSEKAQTFLDGLDQASVLDFSHLEYISSAGLGVLLRTQKRLMAAGGGLKLINVNNHIMDVFRFSGFDHIFEVQGAGDP
ncbi:MAG: STAS domain-containing protein [Gammaproteobacteria bacterium]